MRNKGNIRYDRVRSYFWLNRKPFIIATITGIIYNGLMAFIPILQGKLIDSFSVSINLKRIISLAISFLVIVVFVQINRMLKRFYVRDFANRMVLQMRNVSFKNMISDDIYSFMNESKGDIMNKNLSDINDSADGVRKMLTEVYDSIIMMLGYFISLFIMDWMISLFIAFFMVLSILVARLMKGFIYKTTSEYKKAFSKSKDVTLNSLKNELYYRGFGVCTQYDRLYERTQNELEKKSIKALLFKGSLEPIYQAIGLMALAFVIYFAGKKVMDGLWPIGTMSAFLTTFTLLATKTSKVGKVFNAASSFEVSWKRCLPYLRPKASLENTNIPDGNDLIVSDLSFGFDQSFMLKNISFLAHKGQMIGICGMVHSGKSTLCAALSGLYEYEGSIKLLGLELKENKDKIIKPFISYAPAEVEIFNDTIGYNIAFENKDVSAELKMSCLYDEVCKMPEGQNTILSHSTENLSGGQKKRLQIARCLYQSPSLIALDDPFNAIDIKMSEEILDNIKNNYSNSIVVIVNNQKEILKKMDKILFLKHDSYLMGSYDELATDEAFIRVIGG